MEYFQEVLIHSVLHAAKVHCLNQINKFGKFNHLVWQKN